MPLEWNEVTRKLPAHLHQYIVRQPYESYTPTNQAVWRYVMRLNVAKLKEVAHASYLEGLTQTGISIEEIPHMEGMNRILKEIGWAAVSVDGFIPPSAFMEFQAYNVLVIAADMRTLEHIGYTPAPDIIHEAAGHAPIIANPEYAEYLRRFGQIGAKAIASGYDQEVYEAIRKLSQVKEDPNADQEDINRAEAKVLELQSMDVEASELAKIRNLHWWTVEYGLIGDVESPKIYGAGLLSSIEESTYCLSDEVKKLPYSIQAANQSFDITNPQPQLYVTPNFAHLSYVLEEFADQMSLRRGGLEGALKLVDSKQLGTIELSTGLQVSGIFSNVIEGPQKEVAYIQLSGPTALANRDKELIGHSKKYHAEGFGSPIGRLKDSNLAIEDMSPKDLERYGISEGEQVHLIFESGVEVIGTIITGTRNLQGKIMIISFTNCTVRYGEDFLFKPEWGIFDMAVGKKVVSAYGGVADASYYDASNSPKESEIHSNLELDRQDAVFAAIKIMRESKDFTDLEKLIESEDLGWLALLELKEIALSANFESEVLSDKIERILGTGHGKLLSQGLALLTNSIQV